jgi:hypothetical protein
MAGKAWCCGGGGGGLKAVAVQDTPTVDLSGDGSAGAPLTAAVVVAPEPNGLEAGAGGLLVAPSGDAGNTLVVGADGRLFVPPSPPPADTTSVVGVVGGAPPAVGTARSVDIDVTEGPAGTFNVGARITPPWQQSGTVFHQFGGVSVGVPIPQAGLTIPETGSYEVDIDAWGYIRSFDAWQSYDGNQRVWMDLNGAQVSGTEQTLATILFSLPAGGGQRARAAGSVSIRRRMNLNAGDVLTSMVVFDPGSYVNSDAVWIQSNIGCLKISD